jgi:hypothetical protein
VLGISLLFSSFLPVPVGSSLWIFPSLPPVAVHAAHGFSGPVVFRCHPHQVGLAERLPAYRTGWVVGFPFFNEVLVEEVMALAAGVDLDDGGLPVTLGAGALPGQEFPDFLDFIQHGPDLWGKALLPGGG